MKKIILSILASLFIVATNAQSDPAPKPAPEDYVGKYIFPEGSVVPDVDVTLSGGALSMTSAAGASSLVELGIDSFQIIEFSGIAVFKRGEDKKVNSVHIEAGGYVMDGQKKSDGGWAFTYYTRPNKELFLSKK
jgi:hypothetical protein